MDNFVLFINIATKLNRAIHNQELLMSVESLEQIIEKSAAELERRPGRKNIAMLAMAFVLFLVPVYLFFNMESGVYQKSYAPVVVGWLMISVWISHVTTSALFVGRTIELQLSIETAKAILGLSKEKNNNAGQ